MNPYLRTAMLALALWLVLVGTLAFLLLVLWYVEWSVPYQFLFVVILVISFYLLCSKAMAQTQPARKKELSKVFRHAISTVKKFNPSELSTDDGQQLGLNQEDDFPNSSYLLTPDAPEQEPAHDVSQK